MPLPSPTVLPGPGLLPGIYALEDSDTVSYVITFHGAKPSAREDQPWTQVRIQEATTALGTWTTLETQTLSPVDTDPEDPAARDITTTLATLEDGWYRLIFIDADGNQEITPAVHRVIATEAPYFTASELRAMYPDVDDADDPVITDAMIEARRREVEQRLESRRLCNVAFVPRTATETRSGDGTTVLKVAHLRPRAIEEAFYIASGTDVDIDTTAIVPTRSGFRRRGGWARGLSNIRLTYTHGHDAPTEAIKQAAMLWVKELVLNGPITERAIAMGTEDGGRIPLATPTLLGSKSGIPAVDEAILEHRETDSILL